MTKKVLSGFLATALVVGSVVAATPNTAEAAVKVPKAAYTFDMNKANKNVVAVARKNDTSGYTFDPTQKGGVLPTEAVAKANKATLKYVKGKNGKALYLDRSSSFGAQLKGVKLGDNQSWTVSYWIKPDEKSPIGNFMATFFTCNKDVTNEKNTKWVSITHREDIDGAGNPYIWSHCVDGSKDEFPWYCHQDKKGKWIEGKAITAGKWTHITLVVNTKKSCEYGTKGKDGYVKGYDAWTYVNGAFWGHGTVAKGTMTSSNLFFLGINCWDTPMKASYDDVMFWKTSLTAKQAKQLYKSVGGK